MASNLVIPLLVHLLTLTVLHLHFYFMGDVKEEGIINIQTTLCDFAFAVF